ncbi:MAG: pilus assembly protein PilM [Planctomycetota bacterium]|nr:pilus assembly protein PilM [Planctomycetota bacterium]
MFNPFQSPNQRNVIAVECGANALRLLQLGGNAMNPVVQAIAMLPGSGLNSQQSGSDEAMVRRIKEALRSGGFSGRSCALSLPAKSIMTECIEIPALANNEMKESVSWTAVDRLGVDRNEVVSGHLPIRAGTLGGATSEVLVVATRRNTVNRTAALLTEAGLEPRRAELGALAAMRLAWGQIKITSNIPHFAFLHLESDQATLALLNANGLLFHRSFAWESSSNLNVGTIPVAGEEDESQAWRWRQLAEEILQCLRHIERRAAGSWPEFVTLSGALAEEPGVASAIRTVCGAETRLMNIEKSVDWSKVKRPSGPLSAWTALIAMALPQITVATVNKQRKVA